MATAALAMLLAGGVAFVGVQGPAEAAFPGHNGRIAFVSDRDGDPEIYTIRPDGSGLRQITRNTARESGPAWSPDGTKIAFASGRDGHDLEIYVKDLKSGQVTQLTDNDTNPDFNGGSPIRDYSPAWSPDGTRIVFSSDRNASDAWECECLQLHIMNANGSDQRGISDYGAEEYNAVWSADGTKIAFQRGTEGLLDIWVTTPDGSSKTVLTNTPSLENWQTIETSPDWSPDGQKITYAMGDWDTYYTGDIWKMGSDGSDKQQLTGTQAEDLYPVWSPNGGKIVFNRTVYEDGGPAMGGRIGRSDLFKISANGTRLKRITYTPSEVEYDLDWQRIPVSTR